MFSPPLTHPIFQRCSLLFIVLDVLINLVCLFL